MPSVDQVISDVRQDLNAVSFDGYIPRKYIHSKLLDAARLFIKRENDNKQLYRYPDIWVTLQQFNMAEASIEGCSTIDLPGCTTFMKSTVKLPEIYSTRFGYLLNVVPFDSNKQYIQTTPMNYKDILRRRYQNPNNKYFWLHNGYLVIPDSMVQSVTIKAVFVDKAQGLRLEGCGDPGCIKTLDQDFTVPGYMVDDVKSYTVQKIAGTRKRIPAHTFPNLNELEVKSANSSNDKNPN